MGNKESHLRFRTPCPSHFAATSGCISWGNGEKGELGRGKFKSSKDPRPIVCLSDVVAVHCGKGHVMAVTSDTAAWLILLIPRGRGEIFAWGDDSNGQLGVGELKPVATPTLLRLPAAVKLLSLGDGYSAAITSLPHQIFRSNVGQLTEIFSHGDAVNMVDWDMALNWTSQPQLALRNFTVDRAFLCHVEMTTFL